MKKKLSLLLIIFLLSLNAGIPSSALAPEETGFKMKTVKFFAFQETSDLIATAAIEKDFSIFVGEQSPVIQSAFLEIEGISAPDVTNQSITAQIKQQSDGTFSNSNTYNFQIANASSRFTVLYDVTGFFIPKITTAGTYNFTQSITNNGPATINSLHAELILTYQFTPPDEGYRPTGSIVSSTFDTDMTEGSAPNSILWLGTLPDTAVVKFQFASSNCSNGATNEPDCDSGTWEYVGPDGTSSTFYEPSGPNTPILLNLAHHNNKRYFRYKVTLEPTSNAQETPVVEDIILNWSP